MVKGRAENDGCERFYRVTHFQQFAEMAGGGAPKRCGADGVSGYGRPVAMRLSASALLDACMVFPSCLHGLRSVLARCLLHASMDFAGRLYRPFGECALAPFHVVNSQGSHDCVLNETFIPVVRA